MDNSTKIVTGKVRFSYCHVFEPTAMNEGESAKYSVSVLIPKSDVETLNKINAAIEAAKVLGKAKLADKSGKLPSVVKTILRDGDVDRPDDAAYAGHMFFSANSTRRPGVVDSELNPIIDPEEFYSGCYGRVSVNFYAYNFNGNKGIAAGLNNLQKLDDGEPLAGGSTPSQDFGDGDDADDMM